MTARSSIPSLARVLAERAAGNPDGRAFSILTAGEDDLHVTNAQLLADAARQADALAEAGVEEGALVVVAGEHGYAVLAGFCGALLHGAVPTIVPYVSERAAEEAYAGRIQRLAEQAGARAVLTLPGLVAPFAQRLPEGCALLALPVGVGGPAEGERPISGRGGDDDAYVQFSSGTTSEPKGAVLSHRAVLAYVRSIEESGRMSADDVFVGWAPLFHDLGLLTCFLLPLCTGATGVLLAPGAWMRRPATLLQAVHDYGGTATWMPNFAFARTRGAVRDRDLADLDLSRWRFVGCGGEPIVAADLHAFAEWLAPTGFRPEALVAGYGMAESVLGAAHGQAEAPLEAEWISGTALREDRRAEPVGPDDPGAVAVTSCGTPAPGMDVRIVDDAGRPVGERSVGEIALRGDFLLTRYWQRPDLTDRAIRDGWFHTGDVGYLADGELYVCDRKGDLVIVGGKNVYPDHVEALARDVLGAKAKFVAAFGLPDERLGTERLVVVAEAQGRPDDAEQHALARAVRQAVLDEMDLAPADVRFVPRGVLVRTTSGKVSRASTREQYLVAGFSPAATGPALPLPPPDALADDLRDLALVHLGIDAEAGDNLFEAGADSIRVMEFILTVGERYGRNLPVDALLAAPTLGRLADALIAPDAVPTPEVPATIAEAVAQARLEEVTLSGPSRAVAEARRLLGLPDGRRALWTLCGSRAAQATAFARETRLVRDALASIRPDAPAEAAVRQSLFTNIVRLYDLRNEDGGGGVVEQTVLHNVEVLDAALDADLGTLLVTAHAAGRQGLSTVLAERDAFDRDHIVSRARVGRTYGWTSAQLGAARQVEEWNAFERGHLTRQILAAQTRLDGGGIAIIAGDGLVRQGGVEESFFDRRRAFGTGFAELAGRSGATVLTTFDVLTPDGSLHVYLDELTAPTGGTREGRVAAWVHAYARRLEHYWQTYPGSVRWGQIAQFVRSPRASS